MRRVRLFRRVAGVVCVGALVGALSLAGHGQARSIADRVYSDAQATRGQQLYQKQCVTCHGAALEGVVGPPLAGDGFLSVWSARSLADLVNKIEQTMPPAAAGQHVAAAGDRSRGVHPARRQVPGGADRSSAAAELGQIAFPARAPPAAASAGAHRHSPWLATSRS